MGDWVGGQMDVCVYMGVGTGGQMDGWIDGWVDGWMDG